MPQLNENTFFKLRISIENVVKVLISNEERRQNVNVFCWEGNKKTNIDKSRGISVCFLHNKL